MKNFETSLIVKVQIDVEDEAGPDTRRNLLECLQKNIEGGGYLSNTGEARVISCEELKVMKPRIGFFKYDLFPHVICHRFTSWNDEGNPRGEVTRNREAMIVSYPEDEAKPFVDAIEHAKEAYRTAEKECRKQLQDQLHEVAWFLKPKER